MRNALHRSGLALVTVGAGVGIITANTEIAERVAPGAALLILVGAALTLVTHRAGEHGPGRKG